MAKLREDYPVFLHGVGMSLGGEAPLNRDHLKRFKQVAESYEPMIVSEHLAWSSHDTTYYNDLLPVPYTKAVLARVVSHIHQFQTELGRKRIGLPSGSKSKNVSANILGPVVGRSLSDPNTFEPASHIAKTYKGLCISYSSIS
jgi:uncharacterized protein (UPF0276 family)